MLLFLLMSMYENKEVDIKIFPGTTTKCLLSCPEIIYRQHKLGYLTITFVILEKCLCYISKTSKQLTNFGEDMNCQNTVQHRFARFEKKICFLCFLFVLVEPCRVWKYCWKLVWSWTCQSSSVSWSIAKYDHLMNDNQNATLLSVEILSNTDKLCFILCYRWNQWYTTAIENLNLWDN